MQSVIDELLQLEGVRNVRKKGSKIRIEPFTDDAGSEFSDIKADLSSLTPRISHILDESSIDHWEWVVRPKKRYMKTEINGLTDRKPKGYRPDYYVVNIE